MSALDRFWLQDKLREPPTPNTTMESELNSQREEEGSKVPVRLREPQRKQLVLMPHCIDDEVADHPVRMVMAVAERLDVEEFCKPIQAQEGTVGRDATSPRLLIALWLYACIRRIGSARVSVPL